MTSRKSAARRGAGDVKVRVRRRNLNDNFTITPNDLPRGHGVYVNLEPLERLWLAAGLSCANDWETTLAEIESWIPMGRNRHEDMRRKLREEGFLTMHKGRHPAGAVDEEGKSIGGQVMWVYEFHMDPLLPEDRDELQPKTSRRKKTGAPAAGDDASMPRNPGHGSGGEETAGQAMPLKSGPGQPGHGQPGPGDGDVAPYIEKNQGVEELPPPNPPGQPPAPSDRQAEEGGDSDQQTQPNLSEIVAWFTRRTDWTPVAIEKALNTSVERGLGSLIESAQALREIAEGLHDAAEGKTDHPGRLHARPNAAWWSNVRARRVAAAAAAKAAGPRCAEPGHEREAAAGCSLCLAESLGHDDGPSAHPAVAGDPEFYLRRFQQRRASRTAAPEVVAS